MFIANYVWPPTTARAPGVALTLVPVTSGSVASTPATAFADNIDTVSNSSIDALGGAPASHSHQVRDTRVEERGNEGGGDFAEPCRTVPRYPISGGFTRRSQVSPLQVPPQYHTPILRANAKSAAFGELLEMLRPVNGCPNRRYRDNSELKDELGKRIVCLKINQQTSVEDMARAHNIPSLLVDGTRYFPGSVEANFYDIGYRTKLNEGVDASRLEPAEIELAGRLTVYRMSTNPPARSDAYNGFTPYFKPLQFHAHANGLQDAADMLDRITRDGSYGCPITGPSRANKLLANHGALLIKHLRDCDPSNRWWPTMEHFHVRG